MVGEAGECVQSQTPPKRVDPPRTRGTIELTTKRLSKLTLVPCFREEYSKHNQVLSKYVYRDSSQILQTVVSGNNESTFNLASARSLMRLLLSANGAQLDGTVTKFHKVILIPATMTYARESLQGFSIAMPLGICKLLGTSVVPQHKPHSSL